MHPAIQRNIVGEASSPYASCEQKPFRHFGASLDQVIYATREFQGNIYTDTGQGLSYKSFLVLSDIIDRG